MAEKLTTNPYANAFVKDEIIIIDDTDNTRSIATTPFTDTNDVPRPEIKTLKARGNILQSDESILYLMHMYPSLNNLTIKKFNSVWHKRRMSKYSTEAVKQFYKYLSKMDQYSVEIFPQGQEIIDIVASILSVNDYSTCIIVEYYDISNHNCCDKIVFSNNSIHMNFLPWTQHTWWPHLQLLKQFPLNNLTIKRADIWSKYYDSHGWLGDILVYCTSLAKLRLEQPGSIELGDPTELLNKSIEKLEIIDLEIDQEWYYLSMCVPCIQHLYLHNVRDKVIKMTFNEFETLTWSQSVYKKVHFKITAAEGVSYYFTEADKMVQTTAKAYEVSRADDKIQCIDFQCSQVKSIQTQFDTLPPVSL